MYRKEIGATRQLRLCGMFAHVKSAVRLRDQRQWKCVWHYRQRWSECCDYETWLQQKDTKIQIQGHHQNVVKVQWRRVYLWTCAKYRMCAREWNVSMFSWCVTFEGVIRIRRVWSSMKSSMFMHVWRFVKNWALFGNLLWCLQKLTAVCKVLRKCNTFLFRDAQYPGKPEYVGTTTPWRKATITEGMCRICHGCKSSLQNEHFPEVSDISTIVWCRTCKGTIPDFLLCILCEVLRHCISLMGKLLLPWLNTDIFAILVHVIPCRRLVLHLLLVHSLSAKGRGNFYRMNCEWSAYFIDHLCCIRCAQISCRISMLAWVIPFVCNAHRCREVSSSAIDSSCDTLKVFHVAELFV